MDKKQLISIISEIRNFKENTGMEIIDTHTHPLDVMGVLHYEDSKKIDNVVNNYLKADISEKLKFGKIGKIGSKIFFKLFPYQVDKMIEKTYMGVSQKRILEEMDMALIDRSVMVPIEPWLSTKAISEYFQSERFIILGSIDIHSMKNEEMENFLRNLINKYKIKGIKLHPNLQNFKPQPSHNSLEIGEKLHSIYKFAEKNHLYLLFHGGSSDYTNKINSRYNPKFLRSHNNALLKNFCNKSGESELFKNYKIPIVIAHMGHYGIAFSDSTLLKVIVNNFDNVYFDTACCSPQFIRKVLSFMPSSRILFGSDAIYYKMAYKLAFVYMAIKNSYNKEIKKEMTLNILQRNFLKITTY